MGDGRDGAGFGEPRGFDSLPVIDLVDDVDPSSDGPAEVDPGIVMRTCANCGALMDERKCKLICRCGYFLSCSDYY